MTVAARLGGAALAFSLGATPQADPVATAAFSGRAVTEDGTHWFTEQHVVSRHDGRRRVDTRYVSATGELLAELSAEFAGEGYVPSTTFYDHRDRYRYGISPAPGRREVVLIQQDGPDAEVETVTIPLRENLVTFVGALSFVTDHIGDLVEGRRLVVHFIVPSRQKSYQVRIVRRALAGTTLTARMEMDNWFLRRFTTPMDVTFDVATGRLLEYRGTAGLLDADDRAVKVRITYDYH